MFMSTSDSTSEASSALSESSSGCSFLSSPSSVSTSSSFSSTSSSNSDCQVFLGGSCNPTTWRCDIAIPFLEEQGISYFNPQVSEWNPDLLLRENEAKRSAQVHFFVLDSQTRNTSAMIEVAYDLAKHITLVLVIDEYKWPGLTIAGEDITRSEFDELLHCRNWIKDLAAKHSVPVFDNIKDALALTVRILKSGRPPKCIFSSLTTVNNTNYPKLYTSELLKSSNDSRYPATTTCRLAAINNWISRQPLASIHQASTNCFTSNLSTSSYSLYSMTSSTSDHYTSSTTKCKNYNIRSYDHQYNGNYYTQRRTTTHTMSSPSSPGLFHISSNARSIKEMVSAGYALGCEEDCIICIKDLPCLAVIEGETLSVQAIKDYNRGRAYLKEFAKSSGVPVYECIREAVKNYLRLASRKNVDIS